VRAAGFDVLRVDQCSLVSASEIARRVNRSRQQIYQYMTGQRGPGGFPAPVFRFKEHSLLWRWSTVARWLADNDMIRAEEVENAEFIEAINGALDRQRQRQRNATLLDEIDRALTPA
jgi:predicted DNA-binding transcriptional regulator AlpA